MQLLRLAEFVPGFLKPVLRPIYRLLTGYESGRSPKLSWQEKRLSGTLYRWHMISSSIDATDRTLLDVGCNAGILSSLAAQDGLAVLGIDVNPSSIECAIRRSRGQSRLAFMLMDIDPSSISYVPVFDVVLCLSVHHQWVSRYGPGVADSMLREIGNRALSKFYFEPASLVAKYGAHAPPITDNDEATIVEYNSRLLRRVFGDHCAVKYLGKSECSRKEPFRLLFLVEKSCGDREKAQ